MSAPAVIFAAPATGSGKTLLALGTIRALRRRGLKVGCLKVGPDYIDPGFLGQAAGRPCLNLDSWAMRLETLVALLDEAGRDADVVIGEGVMGLFDGAPDGAGSTADLAAMFGLPVVLTIDASGMGGSVAALVEGFARFREDVGIDGIVLNRVGGASHASLLREACDARTSIPVVGWLGRHEGLALPSRHLGLVQAIEHPDLEAVIERAASVVAAGLDLDRLLRISRHPTVAALGTLARPLPPLGRRIAIAKDAAFAFIYESVLAGWRRQGAELVRFSPLADEAPPADADAVYLPGGYPELHAERLAANRTFMEGLAAAAGRGATLYGECGGYMVLGRALADAKGESHAMAGLLPVETSFLQPRLHLGYRRITAQDSSPLGRPRAQFRGHEFHYGHETRNDGAPLFAAQDARGRDLGQAGCRSGRVMGSFLHLIDRAA
jgi:cobyrinic acid a,c-diamide synthase